MSNITFSVWIDKECGDILFRESGDCAIIQVGDCPLWFSDIDKARELVAEAAKAITFLKGVRDEGLQVVRDNAKTT